MNEKKNSTLSIVALILSAIGCTFVIGAILAIIDLCKNDGRKKVLSIIALVLSGIWLIIGIVAGANYGDKNTSDNKNNELTTTQSANGLTEESTEAMSDSTEEALSTEEAQSDDSNPEKYFKDNVIVVDDYTMKITDWKVIPVGEKGNEYGKSPVIAFWYDTTNTSGKEIDPTTSWISIMEAVQDNDPNAVNELNVSSLPDDQFLDSQLQKIKKDGTVSNAVAYELTDDTTPVELTAKSSLIGDPIGSMTFDIK
ncbi:protein of unknown function [Lachnospiraceae bacterium]|nr:protein of unknown function [Lachnospiraceae bacterium]